MSILSLVAAPIPLLATTIARLLLKMVHVISWELLVMMEMAIP
jgi:hypothetical protein